jgi:hypothetical protein
MTTQCAIPLVVARHEMQGVSGTNFHANHKRHTFHNLLYCQNSDSTKNSE